MRLARGYFCVKGFCLSNVRTSGVSEGCSGKGCRGKRTGKTVSFQLGLDARVGFGDCFNFCISPFFF